MRAKFHTVGFGLALALAACLLAPSIWMLATIPPLWRDVDAYNQVTHPPAMATYWGNGALYCFVSRLPLAIGAKLQPHPTEPARPPLEPLLTDRGVSLLIVAQHLALAGAAFFFITGISRLPWVRLALGFVWMGTVAFYTYAQCIGSETLSMIGMLLLVAFGWRIARSERAPRRLWVLFHLTLLGCLLTRYVNLWMVLLLPLTFLLSWLHARIKMILAAPPARRRLRIRSAWRLRRALLALACGLSCIAASDMTVRTICHLAGRKFHSHMGPTFLWRVKFLKDMAPAKRNRLLDRVATHVRSPDAQQLLGQLRETFDRGENLDPAVFCAQGRVLLGISKPHSGGGPLGVALNEMASAFLRPPAPEHLRVARRDFARALLITPSEVARFLFATTAFYYDHPDMMPQCAGLKTYRNNTAATINALPARHPYFSLGEFTYNRSVVLWAALLGLLLVARRGGRVAGSVPSYAVSLTIVGLLMMFSTCLLGELLPRYTLPMWELLTASLFVILAALLDRVAATVARRSGATPELLNR